MKDTGGAVETITLQRFYLDTDWHTYAFVMAAGQLTAYMDGIAMFRRELSGVYGQLAAPGTLLVGGTAGGANLWRGEIQSFMVYGRALGLGEANTLAADYSASAANELYHLVIPKP